MSRRRYLLVAVAAAALTVGAATAAASLPANLCHLRVAAQLRALPVTTTCTKMRTFTVKGRTEESAAWGGPEPANTDVLVLAFTGISETFYEQHIAYLGARVPIASFAREWALGDTAEIFVWTHGVGLQIDLLLTKQPLPPPSYSKRYVAPMLAFAKALAAQI